MVLYKVSVEFKKDFLKIEGDQIIIGISSKPIKGQANKEIIKKVSKYFGIPSTSISIKKGQKSEKKIVEVLN